MEEKKIIFKWKIGENEEKVVAEEFDLKDYDKELNENGTIAEEISLACMAIQINRNKKLFKFDSIDMLEDLEDEDYGIRFFKDLNDFIIENHSSKSNEICLNFHILEKIIIKFVALECEINKNKPIVIIDGNNNAILRRINEIFNLATEDINVAEKTNKNYGLMKFKDLINEIKKYSPIKNETIKYCDRGKCIALYKKNHSKEITIAFSGFKDLECDKIKKYIGVRKNYLSHYEKIAQSIGAQLAITTCAVSRYIFNDQAERYNSLKEIVHKGLDRKNFERHSCCERKIFTWLEDRDEAVYSGKLFVKYEPCIQCQAAIFYHILNKGNSFSMSIGLPNLSNKTR